MNLENHSKIAGCSHVRIFLAIKMAEKITPKIAVNIMHVKGPLKVVGLIVQCRES